MRIVLISPYAPAHDGLADYSGVLAGGLRREGHEVFVLATRFSAESPNEVLGALPRTVLGVAKTARALADLEPDVVHVQFCLAAFTTGFPALLLLGLIRRRRVRIVATFHDISRDVASLGPVGRSLYRRLALLSDMVVLHTETAHRVLKQVVGRREVDSVVVPHHRRELPSATIDAALLAQRFELGDRRVLLAFGFVHVDKGLDDLVTALHLLRVEQGPAVDDVRLVVAGTVRSRHGVFRIFELRDRLHLRQVRRLIARLGLRDVVVLTGYVPSGEIRPWFELAEAAVLPYRRIEQSGVASLAQSAGTQVLATNVGELAAIVGRADWICPPRSPRELSRVIAAFLVAERRTLVGSQHGAAVDEVVGATLTVYRSGTDRSTTQNVYAQLA